jgi:general nucleoside transport system ATP-binding protein
MPALLQVENLTKRFPGVVANDRLHLEVAAGEVHALLGENGAGKSTLMNILYGLLRPDGGNILWKGQPVRIGSPREAMRLGIGMVHQHFMQVAPLTVLENVVLGLRWGLVGDMAAAEQRLRAIAAQFQQTIDPHARIGSLSVGEQQRVEIFKALYRNAELLILDEPTASLTPGETAQLFGVCRELVAQGKSVIFITHKLDEVCALSNRITVLRHGRNVATLETSKSEPQQLARLMVGQDVALRIEKRPHDTGPVLLQISDLRVANHDGRAVIKDLSLTLRRGEIVGIAGVDGNGQAELVQALLGLLPPARGSVHLQGDDITYLTQAKRMEKGIAIIPADRHREAVVQDLSLVDNALLGFSDAPPLAKFGFLQRAAAIRFTQKIIADFSVKAPSPRVPMRTLSGGHQQRFVFGRALEHHPRLLIAVQPSRGLDLVSADFVRRKIVELRDSGAAVLLISMDLDEIQMLSDRIAVMHAGDIVGTVGPQHRRDEIGLMMAGVRPRE